MNSAYRKFMLIIGAIVAFILLIGVAFALELGGLKWKMFFGPKHEAVRREVFKETRSYNEGKEQELIKLRLEYLRAEDEQDRKAILSTVALSFADYDAEKLDSAILREFLRKAKAGIQP